MLTLLILNESPYSSERSYNGARLARALSAGGADIVIFLMADAVYCAKTGQKVPAGYFNMAKMIEDIVESGEVLMCGVCMDARGLSTDETVSGTRRSSMRELARLSIDADKVLVF